jgi:CTP synthase (UTP-ammonia lyase)
LITPVVGNMRSALHIGIIGDFNPQSRYHLATNAAIQHAAAALSLPVEISWLPTPGLEGAGFEGQLEPFDGLWCAPGSPYDSMQGALEGIRYAREKEKAFIGT